jgi:hypothetical protein
VLCSWHKTKRHICLLRQSLMEWLNLEGIEDKKKLGPWNRKRWYAYMYFIATNYISQNIPKQHRIYQFCGVWVYFVIIWYIFPFWYVLQWKIWQPCNTFLSKIKQHITFLWNGLLDFGLVIHTSNFYNFVRTKPSPKWRKFAQSGHPVLRSEEIRNTQILWKVFLGNEYVRHR